MSNPKTKLNGYRFGGQPYTDTPFWEEPGGGSDEYYTADECDSRFAKSTAVYTKAQTYTKEEVDALIEGIEPSVDAYTKAETDALLANKANTGDVYSKSQVYTKTEVNALISEIPAVDAYTKSQTDALLANKANTGDVYSKSQVYTKTEVNALISEIPAVDAYTKSQTDALLADKADKSDTYTKAQVDALIPDVSGYAKSTSVYMKSETYSKQEVDNLLSEIPTIDAYTKSQTDALLAEKANAADVYTKTETNTLLANKAGVNSVYTKGQTDRLLSDKANAADVYTKTQTDNLVHGKVDRSELDDYAKVTTVYLKTETYTKAEVDALISGAGGGAEIDDSTTSSSKVWSSSKTWDVIKGAQNTNAIYRGLAKYDNNHGLHGTFDDRHTYSTGSITITLTKYDGTSSSYNIAPTRLPWRYMASPQYSYPVNDAQWKSYILGDIEVFMTLSGNVAASAGIKNPYLYINAPKGSGVMSISVTYNNGDWEIYGANESNLTQAVSDCQNDIYDLQQADEWTDISGDLTPATGVTINMAKQRGEEVYIDITVTVDASVNGWTMVSGVPRAGTTTQTSTARAVAFKIDSGVPVLVCAAWISADSTTLKEYGTELALPIRRYTLHYLTVDTP